VAGFDDNQFDLWIQAAASKPLGPDAGRLIESTDGVRQAQPWLQNDIRVEGATHRPGDFPPGR
jgi:hypothetical protein